MQRLTAKEQTENIENRPVVLKERHGTLLKETTRQSLLTKTIKLKRGAGGRQHSVQNCFLTQNKLNIQLLLLHIQSHIHTCQGLEMHRSKRLS